MKLSIKALVFGLLFSFMAAVPAVVATPATVSAAANCENPRLLGVPAWYRGLAEPGLNDTCNIKHPDTVGGLSPFIWRIVLNVVEMALVIVAYIAVFFILYGGFQFIVGGSNPDTVAKGRKTILNAVIGLVISMGAIGITNLVFSIIP